MRAMTVDMALEFYDEWIKGVTVYEGAMGWRIACATLAEEVRRLRVIAMCRCGDNFTEHDPGTCRNCLSSINAKHDGPPALSAVPLDAPVGREGD